MGPDRKNRLRLAEPGTLDVVGEPDTRNQSCEILVVRVHGLVLPSGAAEEVAAARTDPEGESAGRRRPLGHDASDSGRLAETPGGEPSLALQLEFGN